MKATVKPVQGALLVMIKNPDGGLHIRFLESYNVYFTQFVHDMGIKETIIEDSGKRYNGAEVWATLNNRPNRSERWQESLVGIQV